eukprot:TRINITY_DN828_c0_g1_i11.p1 TRINITY_DN828_c0_g1~~TRINITY_DN828_c0_g1_i11.p1  ORF type:complete len:408 (+),score=99.80 TRINITY_DN828_c0_g1_i11:812-2035(+)
MSELERKIVQEKDRLKKEMLNKIKEAKANLLKMTDSQLASTTKRTILENEQMTNELAYQSKRTTELVQKNEALKKENQTLRRNMDLMTQEQEEVAKRNNSSQKVIKMLLNKLKAMESSKSEERIDLEGRKDLEIRTLLDELGYREARIEELGLQVDGLKEQLHSEINAKDTLVAEQFKMISVLNEAATFILSFIEDNRANQRPKSSGTTLALGLADEQSTALSDTARSWGIPSTPDEIKLADQERMLRFLLAKLSTLQGRSQSPNSRNLAGLPPISAHRSEHTATNSIIPMSSRPPTTPAFLGFGSPLPDSPRFSSADHRAAHSVAVQTDPRITTSFDLKADYQSAPTTLEVLSGTVRPWGKKVDAVHFARHTPDTYLRKGQKTTPKMSGLPPSSADTQPGYSRSLI